MSEKNNKEEIDALKDKSERLRRLSVWFTTAASGGSAIIAGAMIAGYLSTTSPTLSKSEIKTRIEKTEAQLATTNQSLIDIKQTLSSYKKDIESLSKIPKGSEWKIHYSRLTEKIDKLNSKLSALESALTTDPAKALAVPILRKDLDNAEKSLRSELAETKSSIDRIYDQNKWFIGLMFTIALSVLGMAISSFFNKKST